MEGEPVLEVHAHGHHAALGVGLLELHDDPGIAQRAVHADGLSDVSTLPFPGLVVLNQQPPQFPTPIAGPG